MTGWATRPPDWEHPITFAGWFHLAFFGLLIPWLAWRSRARLAEQASVPRARHLANVVLQLLLFLVLSLIVAWAQSVPIWTAPTGRLMPWLVAALLVAAGVLLMRPRWRADVAKRDPRVRLFMVSTPRERWLWVAVSVAAGVSEEVTFRGVMFALLWTVTGSPVAAAVIAAIVFGASHSTQGWASAGIITVIALVLHGLVAYSGTLYPAIAAHTAYDIIAGFTYGRLARQLGYDPVAPTPGQFPEALPAP